MIVVDTSVWVDHLNDGATREVALLRQLIGRQFLIVGDLVLCEILQGLRSDAEAAKIERALRRFDVVQIVTPALAVRAAAHYRCLRGLGITVRKTIDMLIGTFCIEFGHHLLHADRDFDPMSIHLGLRVL